MIWNGEGTAYHAEKAKRQRAKDEEQERLEYERATRIQQHKEAIQYSDKLAQEICERVSAGELLILMCNEERMPTVRHVYQWLKQYPEFQQLYNGSLKDRLSIFEEQIIAISDDVSKDFKNIIKRGATKRVPDPEQIARARLRVETRVKYLRAFKPQRWSDTSTLNVKSVDEFDPANFSEEQLEREIADIEMKSRISRVA